MAKKYRSEQEKIDAIFAKVEKENKRDEAKRNPKEGEALKAEAAFLKKWSRGKAIICQSSGSTFWASGKWMTKLDYKTAEALAKAGFATLIGDAKEGGATLRMI